MGCIVPRLPAPWRNAEWLLMFGKIFRKLGLGAVEATVVDNVIKQVADTATGGIAGRVEKLIEKRKKK